jgi:hypothetical protein
MEIIEVETIKKNLETCGMLLIGVKEVQHLLDTITNLEKQVEHWKTNYYIKENVALELNKYNESLILENMRLKQIK